MSEVIPFERATRYDFQRSVLGEWEGWRVQVRDANQDMLLDRVPQALDLDGAIDALLKASWMVSRWDSFFHVRAWRGDCLPVTRIDFRRQDTGNWRVRKWKAGWTGSTEPSTDEAKPLSWDAGAAWAWLQEHAVTTHTDVDGWRAESVGKTFVRAWRGPRMPVRNAAQIIRMRDAVREWRNFVTLYADSEPWRKVDRPTWLPRDVAVEDIERKKLDLAYLL